MAIEPGSELLHYRIVEKLGEGGMGVVWRATDTTLGREVAIKILPDVFSTDAERLARFEREARVLASLTHANIAAIHGFEHVDEHRFLVLELAEGDTLAERLAHGSIPVMEALPIVQQIAAALEAAHDKGIVHRDLKPANIKITPSGQVKVLDFGLAKAWDPTTASGSGSQLAHSPTITAQMTSAGTILGTASYMSPEQARGETVDKRTDIWAFGCVLLEMLTGRVVFDGKTLTDVIASVVARDPDWARLPAETPRAVRRLLRRCIEKNPEQRLRDIADVRLEIEEALKAGPDTAEEFATAASTRGLRIWQGIAAAAIVVAVALGAFSLRSSETPREVIRATFPAPEGTTFDLDSNNPGLVAISQDGRRLTFSTFDEDGNSRLWIRNLDELEARTIAGAGATNAGYPFWSPDGRFVAFFSNGSLKKIESAGGPPISLTGATNGKGGTWNRDGVIVFAPSHNSALYRVPAAGGEATPVTELNSEQFNSHRFPQFLPDGDHFIFIARAGVAGSGSSQVTVGSLSDGTMKPLFVNASQAYYAAGHLFFVLERTLMARPFNLDRLEVEGEMFPVAENIVFIPGAARGVFAVSEGGLLAYHAGASISGSTLQWIDRQGTKVSELGDPDSYMEVHLSPDGTTAVVSMVDGETSSGQDLWLLDVARGLRDRFTFGEGTAFLPVWSPDGQRIVFSDDRGAGADLYVKAVHGGGEAELVYGDDEAKYPFGWSPDGRYIVYVVSRQETAWDLFAVAVDGDDAEPIPLQPSQFSESYGQVSPDGRWLLYVSDASGSFEVFVTRFPDGGRKWQVSGEGGTMPLWDASGKSVYWVDGPRLMTAEVDGSGESFHVGPLSQLADDLHLSFAGPYQYDVTPDGQRFLVNMQNDTTAPPMTLVVNFLAELSRNR